MQTVYQYLEFVRIGDFKAATQTWECRTNRTGARLGVIKWYGAWRQYCYFPEMQAVYSAGCLNDIAHFIQQLTDIRKTAAAAKEIEDGN